MNEVISYAALRYTANLPFVKRGSPQKMITVYTHLSTRTGIGTIVLVANPRGQCNDCNGHRRVAHTDDDGNDDMGDGESSEPTGYPDDRGG